MKTILLISTICLAVLCLSCNKRDNFDQPATTANANPVVNNYKFFPVSSGANVSVAFDVTVDIAVPSRVKRLNLYKSPASLRYYVENPTSGTYRLYDHIASEFPTYPQNAFYYFTFEMTDGSIISLNPFQVY